MRQANRPRVVHRRQLFGGRETAQEVHAKYAWRGRCSRCGGPPVVMIQTSMLLRDFVERCPLEAAAISSSNPNGRYIPTFPTVYGPMVRLGRALYCRLHQKDGEQDAARLDRALKADVLVEIDRGPGADRVVVQRPLVAT